MKLRFTVTAARQLGQVLAYIAERNPQGADHVQTRIQAIVNMVVQHPYTGMTTSRRGLRRILASPYPYAIAYRVGVDEIVIHSVRHTARRPTSSPNQP